MADVLPLRLLLAQTYRTNSLKLIPTTCSHPACTYTPTRRSLTEEPVRVPSQMAQQMCILLLFFSDRRGRFSSADQHSMLLGCLHPVDVGPRPDD
jgi:hypothetical protein